MTSPADGKRIRLAYLVDSMEVGGSELNAIRILERLDRSRFELRVFQLGSEGPLSSRYRDLGVPLVPVSFRSFKHPSMLKAGLRLTRALRRDPVDILHSHDLYSNIFGVPWARLARTPVIIASKRWQVLNTIFWRPVPLLEAANRAAMRYATRVVANSEAVASSLRQDDAIRAERIQVIPNFVGEDAFREFPREERARLFERLRIPSDATVLGVVARLRPVKDHPTLFRALARLQTRWASLHLLVAGSGPEQAALESLASELGLADRIHFAGRLPNRPNLHGLLHISVLPSLNEGSPNAVIEAMAAARPVVATEVGGTPEAVLHGETGLLVPPGKPEPLAEAIEGLLRDPQRAEEFGRRGAERARRLYHEDAVLERLTEWYSSLLPQADAGRTRRGS